MKKIAEDVLINFKQTQIENKQNLGVIKKQVPL